MQHVGSERELLWVVGHAIHVAEGCGGGEERAGHGAR